MSHPHGAVVCSAVCVIVAFSGHTYLLFYVILLSLILKMKMMVGNVNSMFYSVDTNGCISNA